MDNNDTSLRQKVRNFKVLSFDAMTIIEEEKEKIEAIKLEADTDIQEELQEIWNYLNTAERCFLDGTRVFEKATKKKTKVMSMIQEENIASMEKQIDNGLNPPITINQDNNDEKNNIELEIDNKMETADESNEVTEDEYITEVNINDDKPITEKSIINGLIDKNNSKEAKIMDIEENKTDSKSDTQDSEKETNKSDENESIISPIEEKQKNSTEDTHDSEIIPITSKIEKEEEKAEEKAEEKDEEKDNLDSSEIITIESADNNDKSPTKIIEEKPAETIEEKPTETIEEKPTETIEEKPAETIEEKPAETIEEKPAETIEEKPVEITEENKDNSTPVILNENSIEKKSADALLPIIEIPHAESNKEMLTNNTEIASESKVLLPLEEEPEEKKEEIIEKKIEETDVKEESPTEKIKAKIAENNNMASPVVESKEESTIDLSFIDDNQTTDNAQPSETTVLSFEKITAQADKAILVSQEQAKKLRASKKSQKSIFKTIKSTSPEKKLTLEQQVEEMVNQLPILYEQGKTKEAEELSEKISILSKTMTHKTA